MENVTLQWLVDLCKELAKDSKDATAYNDLVIKLHSMVD